MNPLTRQILTRHRHAFLSLLLLLLVLPALAPAQLVNGRFITSFYTWEKFDTVAHSTQYTRAFQSAIFDIAGEKFSVHTHFQAGWTLGGDASNDYRLYYLYGKWKDIAGIADLSFGRLPFFAGIGMGTLDGALTTVRIADNVAKLTLYGGANVPPDVTLRGWGHVNKNFTTGGQLILAPMSGLRTGISYMNRWRESESYWTVRPGVLFEPVAMYIVPDPEKEQYGGVDISYRLHDFNVYGRYDYDLNLKKTQRGQLGVRYSFSDQLVATADFIHRSPRVPYNSFFSNFNLMNLTEYEAGVDYFVMPELRTFVRGAYVMYPGFENSLQETFANDHSFRYTAGVAMRDNIGLTFRGSTGYAGELNSITLQGAYPLLEATVTPNAAFSYTSYRLDKADTRHHAISAVLGATLRPSRVVSLDMQGQWMNNFIVKSDFRVFGRLNVWFSEHMNLFE